MGNRRAPPRVCCSTCTRTLKLIHLVTSEFSVGLNNYMHPRTDAVVITAVLDETGNRILLGRNVCMRLSDFNLAFH